MVLHCRDWSLEGAPERDKCYQPILSLVEQYYPDQEGVSVLVPGAGLGRLAFDFASRGASSSFSSKINLD